VKTGTLPLNIREDSGKIQAFLTSFRRVRKLFSGISSWRHSWESLTVGWVGPVVFPSSSPKPTARRRASALVEVARPDLSL
jgi:hypothetical protein